MNVRLKHDLHFSAGVYYNGEMRMNQYTLRVWLTTNSTEAQDHNTAFERLKYFVYTQLESSIFINQFWEEQCQLMLAAGLRITTMPNEPVDQVIGLMLYYKLNAILENRMIVDETEISSVLGEGVVYLHSENELTSNIVKPDWWLTADPEHYDSTLLSSEKVLAMPLAGSAWREVDLAWQDAEPAQEIGNVLFADFKRNDPE